MDSSLCKHNILVRKQDWINLLSNMKSKYYSKLFVTNLQKDI